MLEQIGRWGVPLLDTAPNSDVFCAHWLAMPARICATMHRTDRRSASSCGRATSR